MRPAPVIPIKPVPAYEQQCLQCSHRTRLNPAGWCYMHSERPVGLCFDQVSDAQQPA